VNSSSLKVLRLIVVKQRFFSFLLACLLGEYCLAGEVVSKPNAASAQVVDYEKLVREIAQKTAEEARARKAQERIDRAKVSNINIVPSIHTSKIRTSGTDDLGIKNAASKTTASSQAAHSANNLATQNSTIKSTINATAKPPEVGSAFRIFKYKKDGATIFADSVPYKTKYEVIVYNSCYACSITSSVNWYNTRLRLSEFADTINVVSKQYGVNPGFVRAIIHAESAFNPMARSRKGAMGLMQLMPGTAKDMGVMDLTNPEQNIKGGVRYLAGLLKTFSGNETLAAAAYNAGPGAVTRYGGIPPYEETQTYVKRVKILADRYKNQPQLAVN
jgi:soluble lytic murein transglycosylase-like protein